MDWKKILQGQDKKAVKRKAKKNLAVGTFLGAATGLAAGLLFAPKNGKETRETVVKNAKDTIETVKESLNEVKDKIQEFKSKKCCCGDKECEDQKEEVVVPSVSEEIQEEKAN